MEKIILISLLLLAFISTKAQDKIVLINKDRNLSELNSHEGLAQRQILPLSEVVENFPSDQSLEKSEKDDKQTKHDKRWCFVLSTGLSTMPWMLENELFGSDYPYVYKNLDKGLHINVNAYYMISNVLGVGAEYSFLLTNITNQSYKKNSYSNYGRAYINVEEKYNQYVNYVGPSFLFQQYLGKQKKISIRESFSAGVIYYRLENQSNYPKYYDYTYLDITYNSLMTGKTSGAKIGIAGEYKFSQHISIGLSSDFIWCELETANFEANGYETYNYSDKNMDLNETLNLSRLDYSIVLHYSF